MLIVNADDWGYSRTVTDRAALCLANGRVTSASAMVFMEDSERAAELAKDRDLDVGLHINLCERFTGAAVPERLATQHERIMRFLSLSKYSMVLYSPFLRNQFHSVFQGQLEEFLRLYGRPPSHFDGHLHYHLSSNMLIDNVIPLGGILRRGFNFYFEERGILNRSYRRLINRWLARRYVLVDHFFSLKYCVEHDCLSFVADLAKVSKVELMVHTGQDREYEFLMGDDFTNLFRGIEKGRFEQIWTSQSSRQSLAAL